MNIENLEYNTAREKLIIKEYGRNIQKLIEYAHTIEDKDQRTRYCHFVVQIMEQMNPHREGGDIKRKLWDHLHLISNFSLDIDSPFPKPAIDDILARPEPMAYKNDPVKFKQYGKNIEKIIQKAVEFEDEETKKILIRIIANHLKKLYLNWNRESVSDELIIDHLNTLSQGKLEIPEDLELHSTSDILAKQRKKKPAINPKKEHFHKGKKPYNKGGQKYKK